MNNLKRDFYQDTYNESKIWEVTKLSGGYYLRQYIGGKKYTSGRKVSKKWLTETGILDMKKIEIDLDLIRSVIIDGKLDQKVLLPCLYTSDYVGELVLFDDMLSLELHRKNNNTGLPNSCEWCASVCLLDIDNVDDFPNDSDFMLYVLEEFRKLVMDTKWSTIA